jgi:hypothetical protein
MLKITKLFTGGTLEGLTYEFTVAYSARDHAEYMQLMTTCRILGGNGFGSPHRIISVEVV